MNWQIDDHGVSPVVGIMLMLVVTIVIAAVVSGFAGGIAKTVKWYLDHMDWVNSKVSEQGGS